VFEEEDPTSGRGVKVFHGFSMNGTGEGRLVYAGRGRKEDYERLREEGELNRLLDYTRKEYWLM